MKKKFTFLMAVLMLLTMMALPGNAVGQTRSTITINYNDTFDPAFPTSDGNSSVTAHVDKTANDFAFKEKRIYKGASNNYLMFVKDAGYLYNTESLGTINSVAVTYSSGTSTSGKAGVYFGSSEQSTYTTTSNATIKGQSQTDTWTNNTTGNGFFQFSTSNKNVQVTQIVITYTASSGSTVATPAFSPAAGLVASGTTVTISCATEGAVIRYTTNGTDPTETSSLYTSAIRVDETMTIKAIGVKDGMTTSGIATASYTIAPRVETPTFSPAAGTYTENQDVIISCATGGASIYYTTNGSNPTTSSTAYSSPITVSTNTTIKAFAVKADMINSEIATASYTFAAGLPFSFDGGRADIADKKGLTQSGLDTDYGSSPKLKFNGTGDYVLLQFNERPGTLTFDIKGNSFSGGTFKVQTSVDGETFTDLQSYTAISNSSVQNESLDNLNDNVRYIKWIYTIKSSGNVALGNIALAKVAPSISADNVNIAYNATGGNISYTVNNTVEGGIISAEVTDGNWITLGSGTTSPISFTCSANDGDERTATVRLTYTYNTKETKTKDVTVTQAAVPANWVLTSLEQLTSSDVFVIVGNNGNTFALSNDNGTVSAPSAVEVTVAGNTLSGTIKDNIKWNISGNADDGFTFYPNEDDESWLYCTAANNGVRVGTNGNNTFIMDDKYGYLKHNGTSRYIGVYNSADWRCYDVEKPSEHSNIGNQTFAFYKYVGGTIFTKNIAGYGTGNDKWYLIASPVTSVASSSVAAGTYDLYKFDQSADKQWVNYKAHSDFTTLNAGTGYLYANKNDIQLSFVGTEYSGDGQFTLAYDGDVTNNAKGWNLMGNPFNNTAYVNKDFYAMNAAGDELSVPGSSETPISAMTGIFVCATEANQTVTFSTTKSDKSRNNNALVINLNRDDKVIDRAIVRFGESAKLSKFQLFEGSTKIYIPQNGDDYAIAAMDDNTQAFSLNFHAKTTGKYTLSLGETSDFSYVHIFDRMTGEDVDMLLEDSYSFIGSPADSEERFIVRLSYNASSTSSETFAYQSGNGIIVNGEGTLEVYDVTGRKVMITVINGVETINGLNCGVYIFRVIGETLRTQKIVVR